MGGQLAGPLGNISLATSGLNTTKNKKVDKSLENLVSIFKKDKQSKSGHGTSLGRINNSQKQQQYMLTACLPPTLLPVPYSHSCTGIVVNSPSST